MESRVPQWDTLQLFTADLSTTSDTAVMATSVVPRYVTHILQVVTLHLGVHEEMRVDVDVSNSPTYNEERSMS